MSRPRPVSSSDRIASTLASGYTLERTTSGRPKPELLSVDFDERPFTVAWEITRACALACVHCRASAQPKPNRDELTLEELQELVMHFTVYVGWPLGRRLDDLLDRAFHLVEQRVHERCSGVAVEWFWNEAEFAQRKSNATFTRCRPRSAPRTRPSPRVPSR